ncbi:MAG: thioredoxin TrxC [Burkholderiales bacterium]|nr:thioredoxin TrxC [Burkholderiales bacterium]
MNAIAEVAHLRCAACGATNRIPRARLADDPVCGRCGEPLLSGEPVELTDGNFEQVVAGSELPVVVDFWAPWCGPCRQMAPQFAQAAGALKGRALLVKVNSDDNPQTASRFGIRSIPTLVRLDRGREVARIAGARPAGQIVQFAAG